MSDSGITNWTPPISSTEIARLDELISLLSGKLENVSRVLVEFGFISITVPEEKELTELAQSHSGEPKGFQINWCGKYRKLCFQLDTWEEALAFVKEAREAFPVEAIELKWPSPLS